MTGRAGITTRVVVTMMVVVSIAGAGCAPGDSASSTPPTTLPGPDSVTVLVTTGDRSKLLSVEPSPTMQAGAPSEPSTPTITIDPSRTFQTFDGVGAALTGSSAYLLTHHISDWARGRLFDDLFTASGADLNYVRVPLSSTDFSLADHTYDDVDPPGVDPTLSGFSLATDDALVVPLLREIRTRTPDLRLMGTPWSAPGWMKTGNDRTIRNGLVGGSLDDAYVGTYARYLGLVATAFADRGLPLDTMTLQNEPDFSPGSYPGMLVPPSQEAALATATDAELDAAGHDTHLLVDDGNWSSADRAISVLTDPQAESHVAGSAFHCYRGSPDAQSAVHEAAPSKGIWFTECSGTLHSGTFESNLLWNANVLLIDATRNWAKSVLLWNLALDPIGDPRTGGCSDCRGLVTIDRGTGAVSRNEEYYALGQMGRVVRPGAVRIDSTLRAGDVRTVAFANLDGTRAVLATNSAPTISRTTFVDGDRSFTYDLPPRSVVSFRWA